MMYTAKPPYSLIFTSACCLSECVSCNRWFFSLPFPCFQCHLFISYILHLSVYCSITRTIGHHTFIMCSGLYSRLTCLLLALSLAVYSSHLFCTAYCLCRMASRFVSHATNQRLFLSLSYLKELR